LVDPAIGQLRRLLNSKTHAVVFRGRQGHPGPLRVQGD
jgi:hypothetical protein